MEKPIEHKGRVVLVEGDRIDVEMTVEGACATCKAAKACGMGESRDKVVSLLTASAGLDEVGDEVMVSIERKMGIKAATYAYIFPFFIMVAVLLVMFEAGFSETAA
uniref:SoxR reducing system RseC family protein n=1 Tax=Methanomethylophilus alvi TaxID=1291540 RepID=UPI0037DD4D48